MSSDASASPAADLFSVQQGLDPEKIPRHVAIIMDGNGRWAKKRLLNRLNGHEKGAEAVRTAVRTARRLGIGALTLYAFSTENWQRPKAEVSGLMLLLRRFLEAERKTLLENDIRLSTIGQTHRLPETVREPLLSVINETASGKAMVLTLALSYGSRSEIVQMARMIASAAKAGALDPDRVDEKTVSDHLYTRDLPDPDLLIRTSGEMRLSNFMLWQMAYTEMVFTPTLWPDFDEAEFIRILKTYQQRERRFGAVSPA
ncbi:isoprenyl transferase [Desulfosarcina sp. OttesenSCG-928-G10]|nr:isoprenyl transferase [Desulfosarcina sp. OttesenSCG-928-G10]MDL2320919.1 isoprenyl transferase [Desulfosarcina sp. OttesenSCG-928-B08]